MNRVTSNTNNNNTRNPGLHTIGWIATVLVIVGALNWLLVGLFRLDAVAAIFGAGSTLSRIVYILVGVSGLYEIYFARMLARESHGMMPAGARAT